MPHSRIVCCPVPSVHPLESLMLDNRVCEAADAQRYIRLLAEVRSLSLAQTPTGLADLDWCRYRF